MTDILWSAYKAAAANLLSTEMNTLASSTGNVLTAAGTAIDNTSNRYQLMDIEWLSGGTITPTANAFLELWFLIALDGTNYEDGSATLAPARLPNAVIPVRAGTTITPRSSVTRIIMPPALFKPILRNQLGVAMAASGNTLRYRAYVNTF